MYRNVLPKLRLGENNLSIFCNHSEAGASKIHFIMTLQEVINELQLIADPEKVLFKHQKFGVIANNSIGVYHRDLKVLAKIIGKNNDLALKLFDSNIYECRLLCSKIFNPKNVTNELMEKWVVTFENWEITDSFCMGLFKYSDLAMDKILEWTQREEEFQKRSGFVIMAAYGFARKKDSNEVFESFFPIIKREINDDRIYVKKAVNWALRSIGKRNVDLKNKAIETAYEILKTSSKSAQWIAKDALKELQSDKVNIQDYPRKIYRP
ncbi:MAG: DNA alkylation repair protein [Saprospiraceae bacterium]